MALSVGSYPQIRLKEARIRRDEAPPYEHRKQQHRAVRSAAEHTFEAVFNQWVEFRRLSLKEGRQSTLSQIMLPFVLVVQNNAFTVLPQKLAKASIAADFKASGSGFAYYLQPADVEKRSVKMICPRATLLNELTLSRITVGMWRLMDWNMPEKELLEFIDGCLALGVTTFDHADIYGNYGVEEAFGKALRIRPSLRAEIELVTKVGIALVSSARPEHRLKHYNTEPAHIRHSVEHSLRSFNADYIDLLLIHRPDPLMHFDEVAEEVERLKQAGKIKAFGVSNFTPAQFQAVNTFTPLATNQIELSPFHTSPLTDGTLDQLQGIGVPPMIWSALGGGRLFNDSDSIAQRVRATASQIAEQHGVSVPTIIYAWLLQLPSNPVVITGSRRLGGVRDAVTATRLQLDRQDWFAILEAATGVEVP